MSQAATSVSEVSLEVRRSAVGVRQESGGAGAGAPHLMGTTVDAVLEMPALLVLEMPHFWGNCLDF